MLIQNLFFLGTKFRCPIRISTKNDIVNLHKYKKTKYISNRIYLFNISSLDRHEPSAYSTENFANKKILSRNFFTRLRNKYWQEIILLSIPNNLSNTYVNNLRTNGISLDKNEYKQFLLDFNKDLNIGRIKCHIDSINKQLDNKLECMHIEYKWKKGFNLDIIRNTVQYLSRSAKLLNKNNKYYNTLKILNQNETPIFTVINNFNQLVIAEPSRKIINNLSLIDRFYLWYDQFFSYEKNNRPTYESLFFINPIDASEYQEYIQNKYTKSSIENNLNILAIKLGFYYRISNQHIPSVKFRLVPDLHEVGKVLFKYRKLNHISFHKLQKYNKSSFQGQPIYLIQPAFVTNKTTKKSILFDYNYEQQKVKKTKPSETIFLSYDTALLAWKKMKEKYKDYSIPKYPKIIVYNLEDYINTTNTKFLLIPSKESFDFIKSKSFYKNKNYITQVFSSKLLGIRVLTKRIVWSLTSRQPNTW